MTDHESPGGGPSSDKSNSKVYIQKNGGTILLRGGHQYYARRKHKSGLIVWACTKRKLCKGLLRIKDENDILEETPHKCNPDFAKNEIEENLFRLKNQLTTPDFRTIPQNYNFMLGKLKDSGLDIISKIPNLSSVKSSLYRERNKVAGVSKMRNENVLQVEIPTQFKGFILADYSEDKDGTRIIVFASAEARETTCKLTEFYGDGTFKSCPVPFAQLYTLHGDTGSSINNTGIIPLVYALMSNRKSLSYVILFSMIKSQLPNWSPNKLKVDYEKAVIKAITTVFPAIIVKGCYFHYNQAIFKKGRELKMIKTDSIKKSRMVKLSAVLPLLPEEEIIKGWVYIYARYGTEDKNTKSFIEYMETQWLQDDFIKTWCVFGEAHRTTNALESWHSKLNKAIGKQNPNIMHLLHILKEDSFLQSVRRQNVSCKNKRAQKSILKDELIQEAQLEFIQGQMTVGHFLEIVRN